MYYIICKLDVPGFHNWPDAPAGLEYLRSIHRHVFNITARIPATHDNRDLEIIQTQNRIHHFCPTVSATKTAT